MPHTLQVGDRAPAFILPTPAGPVTLAGFKGRKLVLFFYPKSGTPGCTREAREFAALAPRFHRTETDILGVSADPVQRLEAFQARHRLDLALGSDESHRVLQAYGVWTPKTLFGRKYMGIGRTTFLLDRGGRIARIWPKVRIDGHADEVLAAATAL